MDGRWHDFTEGLTPVQRSALADNILATEVTLDGLVVQVAAHLYETGAVCALACIGEVAGTHIQHLDQRSKDMLLIQAVRRLAQHEWEKGQ